MARTSHKQQNPSLSQSYSEHTALYNVAIYARLSVEDNGKNSDSIESQITYLEDYIAKDPTMRKAAVFIDDTAIMGLNQNPVQTGVDLVPFFFLSALFSANEGVPA